MGLLLIGGAAVIGLALTAKQESPRRHIADWSIRQRVGYRCAMSEFFFDAHTVWQYVALAAVFIALAFTFQKEMTPTSERVYRLSAVAIDIQVALGIVLWIMNSGWSLGFMQGWLHPILGLAAVGAVHAVVSKTRELEPSEANRRVRLGLIVVVVLVIAAIGVAEMA